MDRVISLLAALVGLIALGGAILVHTNVDAERQQMAADLAQMKVSIGMAPAPVGISAPVAAKPADDGTAEALLALQNRIAALEQVTSNQAVELQAARAALASAASSPPVQVAGAAPSSQPPTEVAAADPSASAPASAPASTPVLAPAPLQGTPTPAAVVADGPTTDCIPLGTRFMASSGDSFPICKTHAVVKVASVDDGSATIDGAGPVAAGGFGNLTTKGCTVMVFSADTSGYAEMRVTCQ